MESSQIKPWRFSTEEDYYKEAVKYMTSHIETFLKN